MKHKLSITLLLLVMFFATQLIGLTILNAYAPVKTSTLNETTGTTELSIEKPGLPFGLEYEETNEQTPNFLSILFAIVFAFVIFSLLMKYNLKMIMRLWFFTVIIVSLGISFYPLLVKNFPNPSIIALLIALPLAFFKIVKPNIYVHNLTELFIYPGIAIVITSLIYSPTNRIASISFMLFLLILISVYDAWAVWKSGIMQKMAKFQMEELHIFGGFLIPSMSKKDKNKIKNIKQKYKNKKQKIPTKIKNKKFKVNLAILGGGDVIFPIITAGVFMWSFPAQALFGIAGLIPALFIIGGALAGLIYLFIQTEKDKAYPAMPYITSGIFIGLALWYVLIMR